MTPEAAAVKLVASAPNVGNFVVMLYQHPGDAGVPLLHPTEAKPTVTRDEAEAYAAGYRGSVQIPAYVMVKPEAEVADRLAELVELAKTR